jgi:hypothetical protein
MKETSELLNKGKPDEALQRLEAVPEEDRGIPEYPNIKGAILVFMRRFEEAKPAFEESLKLAGADVAKAFHPKFNLAEVSFVQKKWAEAEAAFKVLLGEPWRSVKFEGRPSSFPLIYFKICVCQIRTMRNADAAATYRELKGLSDDQAIVATEAVLVALDFQKKKTVEAMERMIKLRKEYSKEQLSLFEDTFVEMGWLKHIGDTGGAAKPDKRPAKDFD